MAFIHTTWPNACFEIQIFNQSQIVLTFHITNFKVGKKINVILKCNTSNTAHNYYLITKFPYSAVRLRYILQYIKTILM